VVLAANPQTGVRTLAEFISYANSPGKSFTFASSGVGSDGQLWGELIASGTRVKAEHVPYKATAQALSDLVAGHVQFSTFTLSSTSPFLHAKSLHGIAVTAPEREFPDRRHSRWGRSSSAPMVCAIGTTWRTKTSSTRSIGQSRWPSLHRGAGTLSPRRDNCAANTGRVYSIYRRREHQVQIFD
jgi:hypothetical protein